MNFLSVEIIFAFSSLILIVVATVWRASSRNPAAFLIGSRNIGAMSTAVSLAAGFRDGAGLAAWVAFVFYFNIGSIWLFGGMVLALILLAIVAPKVRDSVEGTDIFTLNQYLERVFGATFGWITSFVLVSSALLICSAQVHVVSEIYASSFGVPKVLLLIFLSTLILSYLLRCGYRGIIFTDYVGWVIMMTIVTVPIAVTFSGSPLYLDYSSIGDPGGLIFPLVLLVFFIVFSGGDVWQRLFSARDGSTARNGFLLALPIYFVISIAVILMGMSVVAVVPEADPSSALFEFFGNSQISSLVTAVMSVFVLMAVASTVDTQAYVFSTSIATLSASKLFNGNPLESPTIEKRVKILLVLFFFAISIVSLIIGDLVVFLFSSYSLATIFVPPIMFCVLTAGRRTISRPLQNVAVGSVVVCVGLYATFWIWGLFADLWWTLAAPGVSLVLFSLLYMYMVAFHEQN